MLGNTDLFDRHEVEVIRRSIAMLPANTGQGVLNREECLRVLEALRAVLAATPLESEDG